LGFLTEAKSSSIFASIFLNRCHPPFANGATHLLTLLLALVASCYPLQENASEDAILKQLLPAFSSIGATHLLQSVPPTF
jgi:hypothetical protein